MKQQKTWQVQPPQVHNQPMPLSFQHQEMGWNQYTPSINKHIKKQMQYRNNLNLGIFLIRVVCLKRILQHLKTQHSVNQGWKKQIFTVENYTVWSIFYEKVHLILTSNHWNYIYDMLQLAPCLKNTGHQTETLCCKFRG